MDMSEIILKKRPKTFLWEVDVSIKTNIQHNAMKTDFMNKYDVHKAWDLFVTQTSTKEMKAGSRLKHPICVDWWGDCNVPQINTWNKQKCHIFLFSIMFSTIWVGLALFSLRHLIVPSSSAMIQWHPAGESVPPAVYLDALISQYLHNSSGWKLASIRIFFCRLSWNPFKICTAFGWNSYNNRLFFTDAYWTLSTGLGCLFGPGCRSSVLSVLMRPAVSSIRSIFLWINCILCWAWTKSFSTTRFNPWFQCLFFEMF